MQKIKDNIYLVAVVTCVTVFFNACYEKKGEAPIGDSPPYISIIGSLDPKRYYIFSSASWAINNDVFLIAIIETRRKPVQDDLPVSRLTIKNLTTSKLLYTEDIDGVPLSMYVRNVTFDPSPELIVDTGIAASSNQFKVFSVAPTVVRSLLDENYRSEATLINLGESSLHILITDTTEDGSRSETTTYGFREDKYQPISKTLHSKLLNSLQNSIGLPVKKQPE